MPATSSTPTRAARVNYGVYADLYTPPLANHTAVYGERQLWQLCWRVGHRATNDTASPATAFNAGVYGPGTASASRFTSSTSTGYGVYGTITGHGNTGYAGYFINTDTSTTTNYGVYGHFQHHHQHLGRHLW